MKQVGKFPEETILKRAILRRKTKHARGGTISKRLLRDQFLRKIEMKIGDEHRKRL